MYVGLDVPVLVRPARWPTVAGLSWAAAVLTALLVVFGAVLAVLGRDVSILLLPAPLAYAQVLTHSIAVENGSDPGECTTAYRT